MTTTADYKKKYDEDITKFIGVIVNIDSYDEDVVIGEFEKLMVAVSKEIKENKVPYNLVSSVMNLIESQIILNPEINDERRFFIMKCFSHYNDHMLDALEKKVRFARKNDLDPPTCVMNQQLLFNQAYEDSIQQKN